MGILDKIEHGLERAVNGAFARTFKSGLQPVEITAALRRDVDTKAAVVARDRVLVPNVFTVTMSPGDYDRMASMGQTLIDELTRQLTKHATVQGYQFAGGISITLKADPGIRDGMVQVRSQNEGGTVSWVGVLDINGHRHKLRVGRTVIGRGTDADITVDDSSISRKHVEFLWDGTRGQVTDLGSTNGSLINGSKLTVAALESGSVVELGNTRVIYSVIPEAAAPASAPAASAQGSQDFWGER